MLADEILDEGLRFVVQRFVCGAHVRELGVAAPRRDTYGAQKRVLRRECLERRIGMPQPIADREEAPAVVRAERIVVAVEIGYVRKRSGQTEIGRGTQRVPHRVFERPERFGESDMLL